MFTVHVLLFLPTLCTLIGTSLVPTYMYPCIIEPSFFKYYSQVHVLLVSVPGMMRVLFGGERGILFGGGHYMYFFDIVGSVDIL